MAHRRNIAGLSLALQCLLALAAGLAQAASLAWPGTGQPLWWLQIASMMLLAALVQPAQPHAPSGFARGALLGGVFATAWLAGTFWWLFISMHTYGGLAAPLAVAGVLALAAFLASYYAVALGVYCRLAPVHPAGSALLFAAVWLLAELARATLWTGFPWGAGGYAHVDGPLRVLARSVGVFGVSAAAAALAMLLVHCRLAHLREARAWALAVALAAGWCAAAMQRHCAVEACRAPAASGAAPITLDLLQGNIPQDEKFQPGSGVPLALKWYANSIKSATADLVVAPETAIPLLPQQLMPGYLEGIARHFGSPDRAVLLGIPMGDDVQGYTNSVLGMGAGRDDVASAYRYDKHHLVPFGEFIPPFFRWFTAMMNIPLGDFNRGSVGQPPFVWKGQRIAPNICYEDLFGDEIGVHFIDPAQAPTLLLNFSNIGWFGDSLAIDQHLHISRMRALEFERPMVRATNTGATAVIDHRGVVRHALARHTRGVLRAEVQGRGTDAAGDWAITPYAWWVSRWGHAPLWLAALLVVAVVAVHGRWRGARVPH